MAKPHHNWQHQQVRAQIAQSITSTTLCAICGATRCPKTGQLLLMGWHLAHDDRHPGQWLGPAHPYCNISTARESFRYRGHRQFKEAISHSVSQSMGRTRRVASRESSKR